MLPAAHVLPFATAGDPLLIVGGGIVLRGWSMRNPDEEASATVRLVDGSGVNGTEISWVDLLPSESTREWFSGDGIAVMSGLLIVPEAGDVTGSVYYSPGTLIAGLLFVDGALGAWTGQV